MENYEVIFFITECCLWALRREKERSNVRPLGKRMMQ